MLSKVVTPHAAVILWNYTDRISADGGKPKEVHDIEEVVIQTSSIISISTSKRKSSPAGQFEIRLAPRFNWVARITPGSWCAILMAQDKLPPLDGKNVGVADRRSFKMLGRIDSVRAVVEVNQETGARSTVFIATGQDWGSVFDSKLYIDPIVRNNNFDKDTSIGQASYILAANLFKNIAEGSSGPSSANVVDSIVQLWGSPLSDINSAVQSTIGGITGGSSTPNPVSNPSIVFTSDAQFQLPKQVALYMKQGGILGSAIGASNNFAGILKKSTYHGVLTGYDQYGGDNKEAIGIPDPASFFKMNSFWQMLTDNCNPVINEMVTDIRWEGDNPKFALYHRVKPFINRSIFESSTLATVKKNTSLFKNVRAVEVPLNDVVSMNFGTNWRDKINFIEITPQTQLVNDVHIADAKIKGQTLDRPGYERDGFKPMFFYSYYIPYEQSSNQPAVIQLTEWKYLLREWYFNTHMMLNGAVTFVGQNNYIQVGDNIMIDSKILGSAGINKAQKSTSAPTYLLAHVENISHQFGVNQETGARTFFTTVQFVRGIISQKDRSIVAAGIGGGLGSLISAVSSGGASLGGEAGALDKSAKSLTTPQERNDNVFGTSTPNDPDTQKLKGS